MSGKKHTWFRREWVELSETGLSFGWFKWRCVEFFLKASTAKITVCEGFYILWGWDLGVGNIMQRWIQNACMIYYQYPSNIESFFPFQKKKKILTCILGQCEKIFKECCFFLAYVTVTYIAEMLKRAPVPPLFGRLVRCSEHGRTFMRLREMSGGPISSTDKAVCSGCLKQGQISLPDSLM